MQSHIDGALTGDAHTRFTAVTTLLWLIDPVRGEATVHGLDKHPHDTSWRNDHLQKKFLESFALVCSTSAKGGKTASAVCIEDSRPSGTILRVARNLGVPQQLVSRLQDILDDLAAVANGDVTIEEKEKQIAYKIVDITQEKFRSVIHMMSMKDNKFIIERAIKAMKADNAFQNDIRGTNFESWVDILPRAVSLSPEADTEELVRYSQWASQAKWVHSANIERLFTLTEAETPKFVHAMYKLGRYYAATKNLLNLAKRDPDMFSSIHIEAVEAPAQLPFSITGDERPLRAVLKRLSPGNEAQYLQQLGKLWLRSNPEERFRPACRHVMTVHAEMQLLSFYDHNPELTPRMLFMGTSKKACFLCYKFMSWHSLGMTVSASHQKLYPSWMPAPCLSPGVRKVHKKMLWDLSQHLEKMAARDLETRLGLRRPATVDSSAGPSLPTTESLASGWWVDESVLRPD
ncbi:hypothetical protein PWT90_03508 [Aphanocladium album]|nr:hypothetical protein PWT90_03508 [Aphanocladium album]